MARLLVQTTLPHSRPPTKTFVRTNGALKVSISAHPLLDLPYGRYPRLLMAWVTTEAVRTREHVLQLGPSLSSFMFQIGLLPRGGQTGPIGPDLERELVKCHSEATPQPKTPQR